MSELGKPFLKKIRWKKTENQCQNAARENKKTTSEICNFDSNKKLGPDWAVNVLGELLRKKSDPKIRKNSKNQSEIAACEQKNTTEKSNFCSNTVFSLYFKIRAQKNSRRKTTRFFAPFPVSAWSKSPLQFDFKYENVWTDNKKKDSAPLQFKFFEL